MSKGDVWSKRTSGHEGSRPTECGLRDEAALAEDLGEKLGGVHVVVDDQDAAPVDPLRRHGRCSGGGRGGPARRWELDSERASLPAARARRAHASFVERDQALDRA